MKKRDYSTYTFTAAEKLLFGAEGIAGAAFIAFLFYDRAAAVLPFLCLIPFWLRFRKDRRIAEQRKQLRDGLPDLLSALLFAFRAGRSAETAFSEAGKTVRDSLGRAHPLCEEWNMLEKRMRLGESPENLLSDLAGRSGIEELEDLAAVFTAARGTGGNLASLMETAAGRLTDAIETQREIETAVAAKKAENRFMSAMPCAIILYMRVCSPGYLDALYGSLPGVLIMTLCLAAYAGAVLLGERITRIRI
ncbi:MAG: type II secretion system F family protein [Lachnospiraceae bacterium]|nr:type II secretion system F family protein [Lachnospiraceae bacterium]